MRRLAAAALTAGVAFTLVACGDAQEVCDNVELSAAAKKAATDATGQGFEVEKEVEDEATGTTECVWDNTRNKLIGSSDSE